MRAPFVFWDTAQSFGCINSGVLYDCLAFILRICKSKMILPNGGEIFNQRRGLKSLEICNAETNLGEEKKSRKMKLNFFWYKPRNIINCITCVFPFMRENSQH